MTGGIAGVQGGTVEFTTGAVRSADAIGVRYDLISPIGLRRVAETYQEGTKYPPFNWEKGIPVWELLNHSLRHIFLWLWGDRTEDHLAHACWGLLAAMHMEETRPDMLAWLRDPLCSSCGQRVPQTAERHVCGLVTKAPEPRPVYREVRNPAGIFVHLHDACTQLGPGEAFASRFCEQCAGRWDVKTFGVLDEPPRR